MAGEAASGENEDISMEIVLTRDGRMSNCG